jgi:hypothetical protein
MRFTPRRSSGSLAAQFESPLVTWARVPVRLLASLYTLVVLYSPVHYEAGDMRRHYGWAGTVLATAVSTLALAVLGRLVLTSAVVAFASPSLPRLVAFNLAVSLVVGASVLVATDRGPSLSRHCRPGGFDAIRRRVTGRAPRSAPDLLSSAPGRRRRRQVFRVALPPHSRRRHSAVRGLRAAARVRRDRLATRLRHTRFWSALRRVRNATVGRL